MRAFLRLFKIKKDERWLAIVALLFFVVLNGLMIYKYHGLFTKGGNLGFWSIFYKNFHVSGFDCFSYIAISQWRLMYSVFRHPLFATLLYPCYLLNHWLMDMTGINFSVYMMGSLLVICDIYSCIFLFRIHREVIGLRKSDAYLFTALFFSFASIILTSFVPDHFAISMFLLILSLYYIGMNLKEGKKISVRCSSFLFLLTAGMSLTNGAKILLGTWFTNGCKIFRPRFFLPAVVLPTLVLTGLFVFQEETIVKPDKIRSNTIFEKRIKKDSVYAKYIEERRTHVVSRTKRQLFDNPLFEYTDVSASRIDAVIENMWGESMMLHEDHLLEDVILNRPVIIRYRSAMQYVIIGVVFLLFVMGAWVSRNNKIMQLCLSWFAVDFLLHIVLGFGITEVYIMGGHWLFVVPIAIGFLLQNLKPLHQNLLRYTVCSITAVLFYHNGINIYQYMTL